MDHPDSILYLCQADMLALELNPVDMVDELESLFKGCATGEVWNLPKTASHPDEHRLFMSTLAYSDGNGLAACKSLCLNQHNPNRGLEAANALITLFDAKVGLPVATMDGNWITGVRTAAVSALAARYLARADSAVIAFVGCGLQARAHLEVFGPLFPLREIRALGRGAANRDRLCSLAEERGLRAVASNCAREALDGADLVVTTVPHLSGAGSFLDANWLPPGAFAAMVDLARSWHSSSFPAFHRFFIEDLAQERTMPDPMLDLDAVSGDLHDLVGDSGNHRQSASERLAFAFRGLAIGDLALASLAYRAAVRLDIGTRLPR